MANGAIHIAAGCVAGLALALTDQDSKKSKISHHPAIAAALGGLFGKLPDFLEPATNPNHRQFCHSLVVLSGIGYGMVKAYKWNPQDDWERLLRGLALMAAGGYLSHLMFDLVTPKSLPVIGKF